MSAEFLFDRGREAADGPRKVAGCYHQHRRDQGRPWRVQPLAGLQVSDTRVRFEKQLNPNSLKA